MTDREIYNLWLSKTSDLRYLRPRRWEELKKIITNRKVSSVLEFGSGVSTLLFGNFGLKVLSLETDPIYIEFVRSLCPKNVSLLLWNNRSAQIFKRYDLALVDGILPRTYQLKLALKHADVVAIDDFNEGPRLQIPSGYNCISQGSTTLTVFERRRNG